MNAGISAPMLSPIDQRIRDAFYHAVMNGLRDPKNLYLGRMEAKELDEYARLNCHWPLSVEDEMKGTRREFQGMSVYLVDDQTHLAVA